MYNGPPVKKTGEYLYSHSPTLQQVAPRPLSGSREFAQVLSSACQLFASHLPALSMYLHGSQLESEIIERSEKVDRLVVFIGDYNYM
jgi:hypothetical protein